MKFQPGAPSGVILVLWGKEESMGRGMGGEVCNHLVEEAKWGVEIDGRIESVPGNREKICV